MRAIKFKQLLKPKHFFRNYMNVFLSNRCRTILVFVLCFLLIVVSARCYCYFSNTDGMRNITFSHPLIAVDVKDSTKAFIFDENSPDRYRVFLENDMLDDVVERDTSVIVYSVAPRYIDAKYKIFFGWIGRPDYSNEESVENYCPQVCASLYKIDMISILKDFFHDGSFAGNAFSTFFRPSYIDTLPSVFTFKSTENFGPYYFIRLSSKSFVLMVPDCYWAQDDVVNYHEFLVEISQKEISGEKIGFRLGGYDVWRSSDFDIKDYDFILNRVSSKGDYSQTMVYKR